MAEDAQAAIPALREALTDNDARLRIHAAEALAQIEPKATVAVDVLIEAIEKSGRGNSLAGGDGVY
jgi:HEAT repeat protein